GTGSLTVKETTTAALPPGLVTVTSGVPARAIALAGIEACNCVELTNVDDTTAELNVTKALVTKLEPEIVSVNAAPPAVALAGLTPPTTGCVLVGSTVRGKVSELPPTLVTATEIVPWAAMTLAGT